MVTNSELSWTWGQPTRKDKKIKKKVSIEELWGKEPKPKLTEDQPTYWEELEPREGQSKS